MDMFFIGEAYWMWPVYHPIHWFWWSLVNVTGACYGASEHPIWLCVVVPVDALIFSMLLFCSPLGNFFTNYEQ